MHRFSLGLLVLEDLIEFKVWELMGCHGWKGLICRNLQSEEEVKGAIFKLGRDWGPGPEEILIIFLNFFVSSQ